MDAAAVEIALADDETLESLLESSKTLEGRSSLAAKLPLPTLLRLLPSSPRLRLPRLRLLRNLCAGETAVQNSFLEHDGPASVASVLFGAPPDALRVGVQVLGNVALAGEEHRAAVWARFFPSGFLDLARVRGPPGVCDPLCMVLDTCCSAEGGRRRLQELCTDERGLEIVGELIRTASKEGFKEEWLEWLLAKICIEESYLSRLFAKLGSLGVSEEAVATKSQDIMFTNEQTFLVLLLSTYITTQPEELTISIEFALAVFKILKEASQVVDFSSRGSVELPTGSPAIDVLGYSLLILRDICAWKHCSSEGPRALVDCLLSDGILEFVLNLLRELEPPSIVKRSIQRAIKEGSQLVGDSGKACLYRGYRRDLVSVIANCMHGRKQVQDEVRQRNGILLLLQQCVVDDENPLLREWGLLTISYLLEENLENQQEVTELQLQEPIQTPEVANLGLHVEIDEKTGRPKLVNLS